MWMCSEYKFCILCMYNIFYFYRIPITIQIWQPGHPLVIPHTSQLQTHPWFASNWGPWSHLISLCLSSLDSSHFILSSCRINAFNHCMSDYCNEWRPSEANRCTTQSASQRPAMSTHPQSCLMPEKTNVSSFMYIQQRWPGQSSSQHWMYSSGAKFRSVYQTEWCSCLEC